MSNTADIQILSAGKLVDNYKETQKAVENYLRGMDSIVTELGKRMTTSQSVRESENVEFYMFPVDMVKVEGRDKNGILYGGEAVRINDLLLSERQRLKERVGKMRAEMKVKHICRFNDGGETCDCYLTALDQVLTLLSEEKE